MRYLHLFLVFNFVICYAGICGDTVFAAVGSPGAEESCHSSGHDMADADDRTIDIKSSSAQDSQESPCCLDYLNGSATDNPASLSTIIEVLSAEEIYSSNIESKKLAPDHIDKGHDPPDLQISFSTFLL